MEAISEEQLHDFRNMYSKEAFRCRFFPCTGASLGFLTMEERDAHEQLHLKQLFCDIPTCTIGRIGFRRQQDLNAHIKRYHREGGILVPPRVCQVAPNTSRSPDHEMLPRRRGGWKSKKTTLPFDESFKQTGLEEALKSFKLPDSSNKETAHDWGVIINGQCSPKVDIHLQHVLPFKNRVYCVAIDPHNKWLAAGSEGAARVFDLQTGDSSFYLSIPMQPRRRRGLRVTSVCFSPDGSLLATATHDSLVKVKFLSHTEPEST